MKKLKIGLWIAVAVVALLLIAFIASLFVRPQSSHSFSNGFGFIFLGILFGGILVFLVVKLLQKSGNNQNNTSISSYAVVESMKKVFKIVAAEGQLNEVFNYENTKKLLKFIPSTKKALVIVRAKVLVGYDFEKCKWRIDEENKTIELLDFPKPEVLSLDTEYDYYYFEDDLFNFINRKDLTQIQDLAKEQVRKSVMQSNLMKIASEQMTTLLTEVVGANLWKIKNMDKVEDYKSLPEAPEAIE